MLCSPTFVHPGDPFKPAESRVLSAATADANGLSSCPTSSPASCANGLEGACAPSISRLDTRSDSEKLKEVFFGGNPWVIYCDKGLPESITPSHFFLEASQQLSRLATFVTLNCWGKTSSGKSLSERFNLPYKSPAVIAVANGNPPVVIETESMTKPEQLQKSLQPHVELSVPQIDTADVLKSQCAKRPACLMIVFDADSLLQNTLAGLMPVLEKHRKVRAVAVDLRIWQFVPGNSLAHSEIQQSDDRAALFCTARPIKGIPGLTKVHGSVFFKGNIRDQQELSAFLNDCFSGENLRPEIPAFSLRKNETATSAETYKHARQRSGRMPWPVFPTPPRPDKHPWPPRPSSKPSHIRQTFSESIQWKFHELPPTSWFHQMGLRLLPSIST